MIDECVRGGAGVLIGKGVWEGNDWPWEAFTVHFSLCNTPWIVYWIECYCITDERL